MRTGKRSHGRGEQVIKAPVKSSLTMTRSQEILSGGAETWVAHIVLKQPDSWPCLQQEESVFWAIPSLERLWVQENSLGVVPGWASQPSFLQFAALSQAGNSETPERRGSGTGRLVVAKLSIKVSRQPPHLHPKNSQENYSWVPFSRVSISPTSTAD